MNQSQFSFSQIGQQLLQQKIQIQDQYTLELLRNFNSPQCFNQVLQQERLILKQFNQRNESYSNYIQPLEQQYNTEALVRDKNILPIPLQQKQQLLNKSQFQTQSYSMQTTIPVPPPPIFFPSTFSFYEKEQQERQNQEKLRMLLLMKKMKEENFQLKMKLGDRSSIEKSYEESSKSVSNNNSNKSKISKQIQKKPQFTKEDIKRETQILEQLQSKRAQIQLKTRCRRLIQMLNFIRKVWQLIDNKKKNFYDSFPQYFLKFQNECFQWMAEITQAVTQKLKQQKGIILFLEDKINPKEIQKRMELLKTYVKNYVDALYDNQDSFPEYCKELLSYFTHNFYCTPPQFLLKFEINRLIFTNKGGTMLDQRRGQMMILTIVVVRIYLQFLSEIWEPIPASSNQNEKKLNLQLQLNLQTICSAIYNLVIQFLRGFVSIQIDNLKHVANEDQPKKHSNGIFRIKNFQEKETDKKKLEQIKDGDEPLVYPLLDQSELAQFFSDYKQNEMIKSIFEGFSDAIYQLIIKFKSDEKQQRKANFDQNERIICQKKIEQIPQFTKNVIKIKEYNTQILEQKEKINQIQHFLNIPQTNDYRYTEAKSQRSYQQSQSSK